MLNTAEMASMLPSVAPIWWPAPSVATTTMNTWVPPSAAENINVVARVHHLNLMRAPVLHRFGLVFVILPA